jgi:hypothetical protein
MGRFRGPGHEDERKGRKGGQSRVGAESTCSKVRTPIIDGNCHRRLPSIGCDLNYNFLTTNHSTGKPPRIAIKRMPCSNRRPGRSKHCTYPLPPLFPFNHYFSAERMLATSDISVAPPCCSLCRPVRASGQPSTKTTSTPTSQTKTRSPMKTINMPKKTKTRTKKKMTTAKKTTTTTKKTTTTTTTINNTTSTTTSTRGE